MEQLPESLLLYKILKTKQSGYTAPKTCAFAKLYRIDTISPPYDSCLEDTESGREVRIMYSGDDFPRSLLSCFGPYFTAQSFEDVVESDGVTRLLLLVFETNRI